MMKFTGILTALCIIAFPAQSEVAIQEVTSQNGHTAWLVEEHSLPFTALEIRFRGGTSSDRPDKRGAINLMTGLIEEGAGELDASEFAQAREALAASFTFDVRKDALSVSAQFLTENRDEAVTLLHEALTAPSFDPVAIERVRGQVLSHLSSRSTDPNAIASMAWDEAAFGDHPYGSYGSGTEASVNALTREDILQAYADAIALDRIYIAAVGDITSAELSVVLDQLFDGLPATGGALPVHVDVALEGGTTVVPFDTPQSVAIFGHQGITRDDPDFFAAYVVNEVLGGQGANNRLMQEVREERGLTYGIGSYLIPMDQGELIYGQFSSQNARVAEAVSVVRDEWRKMAENGVTQEELTAAQTYLTGAYPLRFDGNATIANIMVAMQMEELPVDYIATRNDQVMAVTLKDANRVAKRIYDPEALHVMVVGQPENLVTD